MKRIFVLSILCFIVSSYSFLSDSSKFQTKFLEKPLKFSTFLQKTSSLYEIIEPNMLSQEEFKQILRKKIPKNFTCDDIENLLDRSQKLLEFIEKSDTILLLEKLMESVKIIRKMIKKVIKSPDNAYQSLFFILR